MSTEKTVAKEFNQEYSLSMRKRRKAIYIKAGIRLREIRHERKLSQEFVAEKIGILRTSLVNMEKGRQGISLEQLLKFASIYQVPIGAILEEVSK
jgi:transcriptional regulator with XRE-family HTH domain